jgi:hypothetical protein
MVPPTPGCGSASRRAWARHISSITAWSGRGNERRRRPPRLHHYDRGRNGHQWLSCDAPREARALAAGRQILSIRDDAGARLRIEKVRLRPVSGGPRDSSRSDGRCCAPSAGSRLRLHQNVHPPMANRSSCTPGRRRSAGRQRALMGFQLSCDRDPAYRCSYACFSFMMSILLI